MGAYTTSSSFMNEIGQNDEAVTPALKAGHVQAEEQQDYNVWQDTID